MHCGSVEGPAKTALLSAGMTLYNVALHTKNTRFMLYFLHHIWLDYPLPDDPYWQVSLGKKQLPAFCRVLEYHLPQIVTHRKYVCGGNWQPAHVAWLEAMADQARPARTQHGPRTPRKGLEHLANEQFVSQLRAQLTKFKSAPPDNAVELVKAGALARGAMAFASFRQYWVDTGDVLDLTCWGLPAELRLDAWEGILYFVGLLVENDVRMLNKGRTIHKLVLRMLQSHGWMMVVLHKQQSDLAVRCLAAAAAVRQTQPGKGPVGRRAAHGWWADESVDAAKAYKLLQAQLLKDRAADMKSLVQLARRVASPSDFELAIKATQAMRRARAAHQQHDNFPPYVGAALVQSALRADAPGSALEVLERAVELGLTLGMERYYDVLVQLGRRNDLAGVTRAFGAYKKAGYRPKRKLVTGLVRACNSAGQPEVAHAFLQELDLNGVIVHPKTREFVRQSLEDGGSPLAAQYSSSSAGPGAPSGAADEAVSEVAPVDLPDAGSAAAAAGAVDSKGVPIAEQVVPPAA
ncbi:hypothetical protein WJX72_006368 [[Myrmecia] bisecta]|uniref:Pentatricopeptide repeat-containing protein n=1 Tax=[Myrmecia] bisecta TaxID=41462 RepID=A0AAW1Q6E4_9CHLO